MPKRQKTRLYVRCQGGVIRYYADFREFTDVGGRREALISRGASQATTDPVIAGALAAERLKELVARRQGRVLLGVDQVSSFAEFVAHHLVEKKRAERVTDAWIKRAEKKLASAIDFFGANRELTSISVRDVQAWVASLRARNGRRGQKLSGQTARHYLNALSNLYRRTASEGYVPPGFNPVAAMMDKPTAKREEAKWLEVPDAALLLEAARLYRPAKRDDFLRDMLHPLLATFLLTGGRRADVLGLAVDDISFDRKRVTFRPHPWRRLKTPTSHRSVPLFPQLEEILRAYVYGGKTPRVNGLLFKSRRGSADGMVNDLRKALGTVAERAGFEPGEITTKVFRHTYTATRLQTLDNGAPISPYTVARELGHGGMAMVNRVYGHLGTTRHRGKVVEYRVNHIKLVADKRVREGYDKRLRSVRAAKRSAAD